VTVFDFRANRRLCCSLACEISNQSSRLIGASFIDFLDAAQPICRLTLTGGLFWRYDSSSWMRRLKILISVHRLVWPHSIKL
jgi:hypothetical protein